MGIVFFFYNFHVFTLNYLWGFFFPENSYYDFREFILYEIQYHEDNGIVYASKGSCILWLYAVREYFSYNPKNQTR